MNIFWIVTDSICNYERSDLHGLLPIYNKLKNQNEGFYFEDCIPHDDDEVGTYFLDGTTIYFEEAEQITVLYHTEGTDTIQKNLILVSGTYDNISLRHKISEVTGIQNLDRVYYYGKLLKLLPRMRLYDYLPDHCTLYIENYTPFSLIRF